MPRTINTRRRTRINGAVVGTVAALTADGQPAVGYPGNPSKQAVPARFTIAIGPTDVGRDAVLLFDGGNPARPVIVGLLAEPTARPTSVTLDGERLILTAEREIELRCGQASLTLTKAGKVLLKGAYVSSRSSGVNKLQGGSVQIN